MSVNIDMHTDEPLIRKLNHINCTFMLTCIHKGSTYRCVCGSEFNLVKAFWQYVSEPRLQGKCHLEISIKKVKGWIDSLCTLF